MKRSLVILLTAVSISAMTAGTAFPAFAEATEAEAEETTDGAENAADSELEDGVYGVDVYKRQVQQRIMLSKESHCETRIEIIILKN